MLVAVVCCIFISSAKTGSAMAAETGKCGDNATYTIDEDTLIISGTGNVNKLFSHSDW